MTIYAKTNPVQTLIEHTDDLLFVMNKLRNSLNFSEIIDWDLLRIIIIAHDLGKINQCFQERTNKTINSSGSSSKSVDEIDHNLLSGAFLGEILKGVKLSEPTKQIIYKAIVFHHKNYLYYLENYQRFSYDKIQKAIFNHIENAYTSTDAPIVELNNYIREKIGSSDAINILNLDYDFFDYYNEWFDEKGDDAKCSYLILKGMLHLCDYVASSGYKDYGDFYFSPDEKKNIDDSLYSFLVKKTNEQEIAFKDFQQKTADNLDKNILTIAFTGSGKTVADHRWSGIRKFYLVPTRISGEAFYLDSLKIYGEEKIGLLHGDTGLYIDNTDEDSISLTEGTYQLTRHLSRPYIISTIDQIATSIFKYPGYEKVFSALINAKVTVDEIHLLTPKMYLLLLYLASFLAQNKFNTRFHFMSATVPQIYKDKLEETGIDFLLNEVSIDSKNSASIKIGGNKFESSTSSSVKIETIKKWINSSPRVLIIVNTIRHAMELYDDLINSIYPQNIQLIHSRFKFEDKKKKYSKILDNSSPGIWIATQVVEVALDIDFPIVISELSPFESLIQRMGRCNREGKLEKGHFYVFEHSKYSNDNKLIYEEEFLKQTSNFIEKQIHSEAVLSHQERKRLLEEYFDSQKIKTLYEKQFDEAKKEIFRVFDIPGNTEVDIKSVCNDLLFNIDPHINLAENKKQAQKLFREGELEQKIILESDFEKIRTEKIDKQYYELNKKAIPVSNGIYWRLTRNFAGYLKQKHNLIVLDDKNNSITYSAAKGLVVP